MHLLEVQQQWDERKILGYRSNDPERIGSALSAPTTPPDYRLQQDRTRSNTVPAKSSKTTPPFAKHAQPMQQLMTPPADNLGQYASPMKSAPHLRGNSDGSGDPITGNTTPTMRPDRYANHLSFTNMTVWDIRSQKVLQKVRFLLNHWSKSIQPSSFSTTMANAKIRVQVMSGRIYR